MSNAEYMTRHYRLVAKYAFGLEAKGCEFDISKYRLDVKDKVILEWINEFEKNLSSGWPYSTVMHKGKKDADFFNMIIRKSVDDYKRVSRFDNVNWIIIKVGKKQFEFIISFWDENYSIERLIKNIWGELSYRRIVVTEFNVAEIDMKEFMVTHNENVTKGFKECSTAWMNDADRFDYIHELYEDNN